MDTALSPSARPGWSIYGTWHRRRIKVASPNQSRPGRSLLVLAVLTAVLYGWIFWPFADHTTTPKLGLDLQGGTSVTLVP